MELTFLVKGKPPKKDGAQSMWGKKSEAFNIVNLRNSAFKTREEKDSGLFTSHLCLELEIYAPEGELERIGDLDNFITGICDGLQSADPRANIHEIIQKESRIDPRTPLLFYTDAIIYEIKAKKLVENESEGYYRVTIKEL